MMNFFSSFLLFLFYGFFSAAQDTPAKEKLFVHAGGHFGFIVPHNPNMNYLIKKHIPAIELNVFKTTSGKKHWQRIYKNPDMGISLFTADLGNPQQLGYAIGIYPFINLPLISEKKFRFYFRTGDGIGIITKPFNRIDNHKNNVIGTRLNAVINMRFNSVFMVKDNTKIETGIGITHFSNGSWAVPNMGINIITLNLGVGFNALRCCKKTNEAINEEQPQQVKETFFLLIPSAGPTELGPPGGKKYVAMGLSFSANKKVSSIGSLGAGADMFYNWANLEFARRDTVFEYKNDYENIRAGIRVVYEVLIGKISLPVEMGIYTYSKLKRDGMYYHRIGIRYRANEHWIFNYTLKSHWAVAENIEFGIGYRF